MLIDVLRLRRISEPPEHFGPLVGFWWNVVYFIACVSLAFLIISPNFINGFNYPIFETLALSRIGAGNLLHDPFLQMSLEWNAYNNFVVFLSMIEPSNWKFFYATWFAASAAGLALACLLLSRQFLSLQSGGAGGTDAPVPSNVAVYVSAVTSVVLICFLYRLPGMRYGSIIPGDNAIIYDFAQPQMLATSLLGIAIPLIFAVRQNLRVGKLITISCIGALIWYIHPQIAVIFCAVLATSVIFRRQWRVGFKIFALSTIFASPTLVQVGTAQLDSFAFAGDFTYIESSGYFRHPHHLIPSKFPFSVWVGFGAFCAALLASRFFMARSLCQLTDPICWGLVPAALFCGYLFIEVFPITAVAKLQLYRFALVFQLLGVVLLCVVGTDFIWRFAQRSAFRFQFVVGQFRTLPVFLLGAVLAATSALLPLQHSHRQVPPAADWIRQNSAPRHVMLMPVYLPGVLQYSRQSVYWDFKRFPFTKSGGNEWTHRFCTMAELVCTDYENAKLLRIHSDGMRKMQKFSAQEWQAAMARTNTHLVVLPTTWLETDDFTWQAGQVGILTKE